MSFWKYVFKTSLEQKKYDWNEFQMLRQCARDAESSAIRACNDISCWRGAKNYVQPMACINYECFIPDIDADKMLETCRYDCRYFMETSAKNLCKCSTCGFAEKNKEYHQACDAVAELHSVLGDFWAKKFANVK